MERKPILESLIAKKKQGIKSIAVLIDPDKIVSSADLEILLNACLREEIDYIFVGGSLLVKGTIGEVIETVKSRVSIPTVLFPGNSLHIDESADAILFLSLISGRNPDLLIGQHVSAAPILKRSALEVMPTGYILVANDQTTTVAHISQTSPIPTNKSDIAICTAMAGEMLGMGLIYLDAGSGASEVVPGKMIRGVREAVDIPLIVGGGINTKEKAEHAMINGADLVVIGTAIEENGSFLSEVSAVRNQFNAIHS